MMSENAPDVKRHTSGVSFCADRADLTGYISPSGPKPTEPFAFGSLYLGAGQLMRGLCVRQCRRSGSAWPDPGSEEPNLRRDALRIALGEGFETQCPVLLQARLVRLLDLHPKVDMGNTQGIRTDAHHLCDFDNISISVRLEHLADPNLYKPGDRVEQPRQLCREHHEYLSQNTVEYFTVSTSCMNVHREYLVMFKITLIL